MDAKRLISSYLNLAIANDFLVEYYKRDEIRTLLEGAHYLRVAQTNLAAALGKEKVPLQRLLETMEKANDSLEADIYMKHNIRLTVRDIVAGIPNYREAIKEAIRQSDHIQR